MIKYYFENKERLFVSLVDHLYSEWAATVKKLADELEVGMESPTAALIGSVDQYFYRHAPIVRLLLSELAEENSSIGSYYNEHLASHVVNAFHMFIEKASEFGYYRKNLELRYVSITFTMMAIYPILMDPVTFQAAFSLSVDELHSPQWFSYLEESLDRLIAPN